MSDGVDGDILNSHDRLDHFLHQPYLHSQTSYTYFEASIDSFNNRDWDRWNSLHAPNSVYTEVATGRKLTGYAESLEMMKGWITAFPDVKGTITNSLQQDDTVILEVTWTGTHDGVLTGPSGSFSASGKHVTTPAVQVVRCSNDLIVETRQYFDMLGMLIQIGAIPTDEARSAEA